VDESVSVCVKMGMKLE